MDNKKLRKALVDAQKAISAALKELPDSVSESPQEYSIGACRVCEEQILTTDETTRGVHKHCYNKVYAAYVKSGKMTLKQLEQRGLVGPIEKAGRKPGDISDLPGVIKFIDGKKEK